MSEIDLTGCSFVELDKDALTITTEEGTDLRCEIIRVFQTPERQYIVLVPADGSSDGNAFLYRFALDSDGLPVVESIADDAEYEQAAGVFNALLAETEGT